MEIDCPDHAVAVWAEGESLVIRFPDHQLVEVPILEPQRLVNVLRMREQFVLRQAKMTVATDAAPCQLQIYDAFKEAVSTEKAAAREAKRRRQLLKRANEAHARKEADKILEAAGL